MTRATSSLVISRSLPATATTPRLLKDRTCDPEMPTQAREIWTPAMISASSAARLMASMVASTLMMLPLRVPRFAQAPLPMTSRVPEAFCSPMRTQILEVPMSQATRNPSGFDIATATSSETIPCAVGADENDAIRKAEIDGPCLPPAILNETARLEQRANLPRGIHPKNAHRSPEDCVHHTETPVRERGDFRELSEILGRARAQILEKSHGLGKASTVARQDDVLGAIAAGVVRSDEVALGADPPEGLAVPVERDRAPLDDAHRELVREALRQRHAFDPRLRRET